MPARVSRLALAAGVALIVASAGNAAQAGHIVYSFSGLATGDLAGTPFTNASFDITASGNTSNVFLAMSPPAAVNTYANYPVKVKISVAGLGTFKVTDPSYALENAGVLTGWGVVTHAHAISDFLYVIAPTAFKFYTLLTGLKPVTGFGVVPYPNNNGNPSHANTNQGVLTFTQVGESVVFSATVPEPQTWAMMILGLGGVGAALRRRRVAAAR
jgi:hypothetical protein